VQERLAELEKGNAPMQDQILLAALFAGTPISRLQSNLVVQDTINDATLSADKAYHARHEYALRWLLKKLQEDGARRCPAAWRLLRILLGNVPVRNVARILNERKFIITLRQALEEAVGRKDTHTLHKSVTAEPCDESSETVTSSPVKDKRNKNTSRKRKRDGKMVDHERNNDLAGELSERDVEMQMAIYEATNCMIHMSKHSDSTSDVFTSEYMKSSLRTSDEEAARILGGWLILCQSPEHTSDMDYQNSLLDPFLEIWELRVIGTDPFGAYRRHCLCPSLAILSAKSQPAKWKSQLEQLLVRNVIVPAKIAYRSSNKIDLLRKLVSDIVSRQPLFSPTIFNIAIRCIQPHLNRPRPQHDTAWLQEVFTVLRDAMADDSDTSIPAIDLEQKLKDSGSSTNIIQQLLQACINKRITLELPLLHSITSRYGLKPRDTDWNILSTIIMLDVNVFLIPPHSTAPLNDLLSRITLASVNASWSTIADRVIDDVLVPLMSEFAKARQLTAFIHLWFEQLVVLEGLCQSQEHNFLNAWEDDALLLKLKDLLEASLTTIQIVEIIDWLQKMIAKSEGSFYVLLDAVVGAVSREETIDAVKPMIYKIINVHTQFEETEYRYKSRRWRTAAHYFRWSLAGHFIHISDRSAVLSSLLPLDNSVWTMLNDVERVEALRCLCAAWINERDISSGNATTSALIELFQQVTLIVDSAIATFESPPTLGEDKWGERIVSKHRGSGWLICAYAHCILVEYPEVLE
jgi:nucleolar pre-ribosomal-associated protein 2